MEKISNLPVVWISFIILGLVFILKGWFINSVARAYTGFTIFISALGFLFLSWNMIFYGLPLLALATTLLGFGIRFSDFIKDLKPTIFPPKDPE